MERVIRIICCLGTNLGDLMAQPSRYFNLGRPVQLVDVWSDEAGRTGDDLVIGGGGMLYFGERIRDIAQAGSRAVLWGVGLNRHETPPRLDRHPGWLSAFKLVGVRDWGHGHEWVPCPSCMAPEFTEGWKRPIMHDMVIYEHQECPIPIEGFPKLDNTCRTLEEAATFISSGKTVLTNSYHGAYWAALLGRRVLLYEPWSTKFLYYRHPPLVCDRHDWKTKMKLAPRYPGALRECREANVKFHGKVMDLLAA